MATPYNNTFFANIDDSAVRSARVVVPVVLELLQPVSLLDVGSGNGGWSAEFMRHGITDYLCVDGAYVNRSMLRVPEDRFRETDIAKPFDLGRRFDLAVCLEVGEHLDSSVADNFVDNLMRHADVVLFSAAVPHQGGTHHVNEQWPDYWAAQFCRRDYRCFDALRWAIWREPGVAWWYKQNILIYANERGLNQIATVKLVESEVAVPQSVIHPDIYLAAVGALQGIRDLDDVPRLPWAARAFLKSASASAQHRVRKIVSSRK